jgi:hypothetical protein
MIASSVLLFQVLLAGFLAAGCALCLLQVLRRNLSAEATPDMERFSYGAANDFEIDYRRLLFRRGARSTLAAS